MTWKNYLFDSSVAHDSSKPVFSMRNSGYIDRFKVLECMIPSSWYSTASNNNTVNVTVGGSIYNATIPSGNYTVSTFPAALQSALTTAVANGWTVTFNDVQRNLTITGTTAFTFNNYTAGTSAFKQIGMEKNISTASGTTWTGSVIDLSGITSLLLTSTQLTSRDVTYSGYGQVSVLLKIDIAGPVGSYIQYRNPGSYVYMGSDLHYADFQLLDGSTLLPVNLNGKSFSLNIGICTDSDDPVTIM
ncbi:MAG: hypothetical protein JWO77_3906 [Ilumatobacteraceae bacterium]|nr:hypothetical protein [Ilumatobacteraceae bacterium]MDB5177432.1 hypothetical protein [Candidatus Saccharibacteria bacterium]